MPRFEQGVNRREFVHRLGGPAMLKSLGANDAITGRGIFQQEQIARAVELELGAPGPDAIEIVTRDGERRACADTRRAILAQVETSAAAARWRAEGSVPGGLMSDDLVVLWSDHDPAHDVWYEIVQLGEGEFELRVLCDGYLWLTEEGPDWRALLDRAGEIRADLQAQRAP